MKLQWHPYFLDDPLVISRSGNVYRRAEVTADPAAPTLRPLYNVVIDGILRSISVAIDNGCHRAAVLLIYAGMDTMAFSALRAGEAHDRRAFIAWANRYMRFPGQHQLTGEDFYGARCAVIHTYGVDSTLSQKGKCRRVGYMVGDRPAVMLEPQVDATLVMVNVTALKNAFIGACVAYLDDAAREPGRLEEILKRLETCFHALPGE